MNKLIPILIFNFCSMCIFAQNFDWAKGIGNPNGPGEAAGSSIVVDSKGNVYTTGYFHGTIDFDPGNGTYNLTSDGSAKEDIYVSKIDASGNFLWAKKMGGLEADYGSSIAIDDSGYVYTTGQYSQTVDFDPGTNIFNLSAAGLCDIFILKLDPLGNFVWAKSIGGTDLDAGFSLAVDRKGNTYCTGYFSDNCDFDPGLGIFYLTSDGYKDIFILKLNTAGSFVWAKKFGGVGAEWANSIAIDTLCNIYTTGFFNFTVDFDPNSGTTNLTSNGGADIFISKLDSAGNYIWARNMGSVDNDYGLSLTVGSSGNVYTTGYFNGMSNFDPIAGNSYFTSNGLGDIFIVKLDVSGNLVWAETFGGSYYDLGNSIAIDRNENIYTAGTFRGTVDFDPSSSMLNLTSIGPGDTFISKLDSAGNFVWAENIGGLGVISQCITISKIYNIYVTGYFFGTTDFDPGTGTDSLKTFGNVQWNAFILKLNSIPTAIESNINEIKFNVYPNPTTSNLFLNFSGNTEKAEIWVCNLLGEKISSVFIGDDQSRITIDVSNLSSSIYFVEVFSGSNISREKFIKLE